jgi:hypothetical protein
MLKRHGRDERVDHRSYERQGLDIAPGRHYGPAAAHMAERGVDHDRLEEAVSSAERQDAALAIDRQIEALQSGGRGSHAIDHGETDRPRQREGGPISPARDDDVYRGR